MPELRLIIRRYSKTTMIGMIILILCLIPSSQLNKLGVQITFEDLIIHFLMFFAFSAALFYDITKAKLAWPKKKRIFITVVSVSMCLGFSTELLQEFITPLNRTGSISDLAFDFLGSISGAGYFLIIKRKSFPEK